MQFFCQKRTAKMHWRALGPPTEIHYPYCVALLLTIKFFNLRILKNVLIFLQFNVENWYLQLTLLLLGWKCYYDKNLHKIRLKNPLKVKIFVV
jgi:hypothetical protein